MISATQFDSLLGRRKSPCFAREVGDTDGHGAFPVTAILGLFGISASYYATKCDGSVFGRSLFGEAQVIGAQWDAGLSWADDTGGYCWGLGKVFGNGGCGRVAIGCWRQHNISKCRGGSHE